MIFVNQLIHKAITKLAIVRSLNEIYKKSPMQWRIACFGYFKPFGAHYQFIGKDPLFKPNNLYPQKTRVAIGN